MLEKLKSRKLIVTLIAAVLIIANEALGEPLDKETVYTVAGLLASYVLGQGIADVKTTGGGADGA